MKNHPPNNNRGLKNALKSGLHLENACKVDYIKNQRITYHIESYS